MRETHSQKVSKSLKGKYGEESRRWKGIDASYVAKHMWLTKHYDKGDACEECGTTNASRLEWANISGKYLRDRKDYKVLCPSCHRKTDLNSTHCRNGHEYTPETTYLTKQGWRDCRICRKEAQKRYKERKRREETRNA